MNISRGLPSPRPFTLLFILFALFSLSSAFRRPHPDHRALPSSRPSQSGDFDEGTGTLDVGDDSKRPTTDDARISPAPPRPYAPTTLLRRPQSTAAVTDGPHASDRQAIFNRHDSPTEERLLPRQDPVSGARCEPFGCGGSTTTAGSESGLAPVGSFIIASAVRSAVWPLVSALMPATRQEVAVDGAVEVPAAAAAVAATVAPVIVITGLDTVSPRVLPSVVATLVAPLDTALCAAASAAKADVPVRCVGVSGGNMVVTVFADSTTTVPLAVASLAAGNSPAGPSIVSPSSTETLTGPYMTGLPWIELITSSSHASSAAATPISRGGPGVTGSNGPSPPGSGAPATATPVSSTGGVTSNAPGVGFHSISSSFAGDAGDGRLASEAVTTFSSIATTMSVYGLPLTGAVTVGAQPFSTAGSVGLAVASSTLSFGRPAATIAGAVYSVAPSAEAAAAGKPPTSFGCPATNGTSYTSSGGNIYRIACNTDYVGRDIFPYLLAGSFDACVTRCDLNNADAGNRQCLGAVFVPERLHGLDDCYLKYVLDDPTPAMQPMEAAVLVSKAPAAVTSRKASDVGPVPTSSGPSPGAPSRVSSVAPSRVSSRAPPAYASGHSLGNSSSGAGSLPSSSPGTRSSDVAPGYAKATASGISPGGPSSGTSPSSANSPVGTSYASGTSVIVPVIDYTHLHGPSRNQPTTQYIKYSPPAPAALAPSILVSGVNKGLATDYAISMSTGVLDLNDTSRSLLAPLSNRPHLSRDCGKGGFLNGQHLFIFCDTGTYTTQGDNTNGNFLGFVSSSVAVDVGMHGLVGSALSLQDGVGEWSDSAGRMRGFAPLTEGEEVYNTHMQGKGQRWAIWPESSLIPLEGNTAMMMAPIIYDNVNPATKATTFTYTGATLLTITAGGPGGPVAQRAVERLFEENEVEWGCVGGIRSWGASGPGGSDGYVYLFGSVRGGLLLARAPATGATDRGSYEYWTGLGWSHGMQGPDSKAYFLQGSFMDVDVFYSPRHLTFIVTYMTIYADSTMYWRYLEADGALVPRYAGGKDDGDFVENIVRHKWSAEQVLYKTSPGLAGQYTYAGGTHLGYFGVDDIANGGTKMLLSWTAPTGQDPSSANSEYQIVTGEVNWV